ncbi:MAG: protein kinase, partial [Myxococcales bacterium]|nr:protein kinase [Myxococcales bacterium]
MASRPDAQARHAQLMALFDALCEAPAAVRAARLERLQDEDAALARQLIAMLAADEATLAFDAPQAEVAAPELPPRYRDLRLLGAGGMGEVHLAHDPILDREVALKILPGAVSRAGGGRSGFLREARAAAGLNHPHITTLHEVGEADGRHFIAFEYVRGRSLRERLRDGALDQRELLALAQPLAEALAFAHAR